MIERHSEISLAQELKCRTAKLNLELLYEKFVKRRNTVQGKIELHLMPISPLGSIHFSLQVWTLRSDLEMMDTETSCQKPNFQTKVD